jgi:hypothetical protein
VISIEDARAALFGRLNDNWSTTNIVWPGVGADTQDDQEWIEPDVVGVTQEPQRPSWQRTATELQVRVFVREGGTNAYRPDELADELTTLFENVAIQTADARIVRCLEGELNMVGEVEGVRGYVVRFPIIVENPCGTSCEGTCQTACQTGCETGGE